MAKINRGKSASSSGNTAILRAYAMPHPPIILPEVGQGEEKKIQATIDAMERACQEIAKLKPDTVVISSPHAPAYRDAFFLAGGPEARGDLRQFGLPRSSLELKVSYDQDLAQRLSEIYQDIPLVSPRQESQKLDHASLIPLRFLQAHYQDFQVLRLGLSAFEAADHYRLGRAVAQAAQDLGRRVVFIASGDLSHVLREDGPYGFRPEGPKFDHDLTDILSRAAFDELLAFPEARIEEAAQCGIRSFQIMAGALDGLEVEASQYSYEGPFGVGYAVVAFQPGEPDPSRHFVPLELREACSQPAGVQDLPAESDPYIALARATIQDYVLHQKVLDFPANLPEEMKNQRAGAFVSLHSQGQLRGCIGTIGPTTDSLAEEIRQNAISAATEDPRFAPLRPDELADLEISVDILSPPEPIQSKDQLDPQRYGVIVSRGYRRGLLLPRLEGVDSVDYQIAIALQKAGIHPDEPYKLERFEVVRHE